MSPPRFTLGDVVATTAALQVMSRLGTDGLDLLARHLTGDWGDIEAEDRALNDRALEYGERLFSAYGREGDRLYIITEADRSVTTILTPGDY